MKPLWFTRTITHGMSGPDVDVVRRKLGLQPGVYDATCERLIRAMSQKANAASLGEVNDEIAGKLGESEANLAGLTPEWYTRELNPSRDGEPSEGEDVRLLRGRLALDTNTGVYTPEVWDAVKRFQSQHRLFPDGVVDEKLSCIIG